MLHTIPESAYRARLLEVVELQKQLVEALCSLAPDSTVDLDWLKTVWPTVQEDWLKKFWKNDSGKRAEWIGTVAAAQTSDKDVILALLEEQHRFAELYKIPPTTRLTKRDWKPLVFAALNQLLKAFYAPLFYKNEGFPNSDGSRIHKDIFIDSPTKICPYSDDLVQDVKLDHFLPKDQFPFLSLHPDNLIPCGTDANSVGHKSNTVPLDFDATDQAGEWFHPRFNSAKDKFDVGFAHDSESPKATLRSKATVDTVPVRNLDALFDLSEFWSRHLTADVQHVAGVISGELCDEKIAATESEVRRRLTRYANQKKRGIGREPLAIVQSYLYAHILNDPKMFAEVLTTCIRDTNSL